MAESPFILGGVTFADFEVPEKLPFGGEHLLKEHALIGGRKVVDAMGRDDLPLEWTGHFLGPDALTRARALDAMRVAGKAVEMSWSELRYRVVVRRFVADFEKPYQMPYSITCVVVEDLANPVTPQEGSGVDSMLTGDLSTAQTLSDRVGDGALSSLMGSLDSAVGAVSSFADATRTTINSVLGPLNDVQDRVGDLITSVSNSLGSVTTLGGVMPNNPLSTLTASLNSQVADMVQLPVLYELDAVLGRMETNLTSVGDSGARVVTAGGDLFTLAAETYGDATAWTTIAAANGLVDPVLEGVQTIQVPPSKVDNGGVLQP